MVEEFTGSLCQLNSNSIDSSCQPNIIESIPSIIGKPITYNRHDIPRDLRLKIYKILEKNLFSGLKNMVKPIDIDFLKVSTFSNLTKNYLMEIFLLNNSDYSTNKFIIDFNYSSDNIFSLKDMRVYSFKDNVRSDHIDNNIYGLTTGSVINSKNLKKNRCVAPEPVMDKTPEFTEILFEKTSGDIRNIYDYNNTILPAHIADKSLYATMTPDFFNTNLYNVENNQLFSRTRGIVSFPTAR
jgi:hypothetical protein